MSLATKLTQLAEVKLPKVALRAMPDLMNVIGETKAQGTGGGQVKSAATAVYEYVPVLYELTQVEKRLSSADKLISIQQYKLTFPMYEGFVGRINVDPKNHRLVVLARGDEPEKTFRIASLRDNSGVYWEAICDKEN